MTGVSNLVQTVPFFWVVDIDASLRFYRDGLGFAMTRQWEPEGQLRWCFLERETVAIMLQEFWTEGINANLTDAPLGSGVSICFICRDAPALYREFVGRGLLAKRPFVGNGMWVTELRDPDGYHLVFESVTDEPEETVYDA